MLEGSRSNKHHTGNVEGSRSNKRVFLKIAMEIEQDGFSKSAEQCASRIKT